MWKLQSPASMFTFTLTGLKRSLAVMSAQQEYSDGCRQDNLHACVSQVG